MKGSYIEEEFNTKIKGKNGVQFEVRAIKNKAKQMKRAGASRFPSGRWPDRCHERFSRPMQQLSQRMRRASWGVGDIPYSRKTHFIIFWIIFLLFFSPLGFLGILHYKYILPTLIQGSKQEP